MKYGQLKHKEIEKERCEAQAKEAVKDEVLSEYRELINDWLGMIPNMDKAQSGEERFHQKRYNVDFTNFVLSDRSRGLVSPS